MSTSFELSLLHDYAGIKDAALAEDHHVYGPWEAEKLLKTFSYPVEKIEAVKHAIAVHRDSVKAERKTPEAECLATADAMAHIEQVPSLLYLVYAQRQMGIDEGADWVRAKLERTWEKPNPQMREQVRDQYLAVLKTLSKTSAPRAV